MIHKIGEISKCAKFDRNLSVQFLLAHTRNVSFCDFFNFNFIILLGFFLRHKYGSNGLTDVYTAFNAN
jgi:hypothetical protein